MELIDVPHNSENKINQNNTEIPNYIINETNLSFINNNNYDTEFQEDNLYQR